MVRVAAAITVTAALVTALPYMNRAVLHASRAVVAEAHVATSAASSHGRSGYVSAGWFARRVTPH